MSKISNEYQADYFAWQSQVGRFGAKANLFKFQKYVKPDYKVLDYGCGGGFLLSELVCERRVGLDINPVIEAPNGVEIYRQYSILKDLVGSSFFDVVITNHALEHVENPSQALIECFDLLKPGGTIIVVVPSETHWVRYRTNDINKHIVTFAPINLGNLLALTGFDVLSVKRLFHKWPPKHLVIAKLSWRFFHFLSYLYGILKFNSIQLIAVAKKPL
jgi:2-polyprenyl-3-methyl-5-hydroxy-6-metoxy-1,4-benzoquinol methylase